MADDDDGFEYLDDGEDFEEEGDDLLDDAFESGENAHPEDGDVDELGNPKHRCSICKSVVPDESMYVLDACKHRFCRFCISREIDDALKTSVTVCCPLKECNTPLSVKDTMTLVKEAESSRGALDFVEKAREKRDGASSKKATQRIAAELKSIQKGDPSKSGFSVELVHDDMYLWEVKLFGFDPKDEEIARDMQRMGVKYIVIHIRFPEDFPLSPPFCRIVRPKFQFRTGHVTLGGSICTELLTRKGWSPENSIEAVIMTIRSNFLEGGARLESAHGEYSEREAREAFDRLCRNHGWQ